MAGYLPTNMKHPDSIISGGIENRRRECTRLTKLMLQEIQNCNFGLANEHKRKLSEQIDIMRSLQESERRMKDDLRTR